MIVLYLNICGILIPDRNLPFNQWCVKNLARDAYLSTFIYTSRVPGSNSQLGAFHSIKSSLSHTHDFSFFFRKPLSSFSRRQCAHSASKRRKHYCKCPPCFHFTQDRTKLSEADVYLFSKKWNVNSQCFGNITLNVNMCCNANLKVTPRDLRKPVRGYSEQTWRMYAKLLVLTDAVGNRPTRMPVSPSAAFSNSVGHGANAITLVRANQNDNH